MKNIIEVTDIERLTFPLNATMRGQVIDYKRTDTPVEVLGYSGMERHYLRVRMPWGEVKVCSDSMLYVSN